MSVAGTPFRGKYQSMYMATTPLFIRFLRGNIGATTLENLEQVYDVSFQQGVDFLRISHNSNVDPKVVEAHLRKIWHDISFKWCQELSTLAAEQSNTYLTESVVLSVPQAALAHFFSSSVMTSSGLSDFSVDQSGVTKMSGSVRSVQAACQLLNQLFDQHLRNVRSSPAKLSAYLPYTDDAATRMNSSPLDHYESQMLDSYTSHVLDRPDITMAYTTPKKIAGTPRSYSATPRKKKERLLFMVKCIDAPRLIGTRGNTKKRLEEITGCQIILHTESRQEGLFPVEVSSTSAEDCDRAKQYIELFIVNEGFPDDVKKGASKTKQMLQLSPRKKVGLTPRKEPAISTVQSESQYDE